MDIQYSQLFPLPSTSARPEAWSLPTKRTEGLKKEFQEFLTARSRWSLDKEDQRDGISLFAPGDPPRGKDASLMPMAGLTRTISMTKVLQLLGQLPADRNQVVAHPGYPIV